MFSAEAGCVTLALSALGSPDAHCSPDDHDLSLGLCQPRAPQSARAIPFNPPHTAGTKARDAVPATQTTSPNRARRETVTLMGAALLRVPSDGVWGGGAPSGMAAELSFPPHHQGAKDHAF